MKNVILLLVSVTIFSTMNLFANGNAATSDLSDGYCEWNAWFKYPQHNGQYEAYQDVYVRVDPKKYQDIEFIELYINNQFVRKESNYPYEWCVGSGNSDHYLRNMQPGQYKLKARIRACGKYYEIYCDFTVKGGGNNYCEWESWFKYPQNNGQYEAYKDVYVRVDPKKYQDIEYMELYINDQFVRKESNYPYEWCVGSGDSDHYLRNMKPGTYKLKVKIKDRCGKYHELYCDFYVKGHPGGNGNGNGHCEWNSWFKYPQNNGNYQAHKDVYVRVDTKKYQDVEYMELYVNNQFVRKESNYPYEWCVGSGSSDPYLRKLKPGTYNLKVRIKDKCGEYHEEYCKFYVR